MTHVSLNTTLPLNIYIDIKLESQILKQYTSSKHGQLYVVLRPIQLLIPKSDERKKNECRCRPTVAKAPADPRRPTPARVARALVVLITRFWQLVSSTFKANTTTQTQRNSLDHGTFISSVEKIKCELFSSDRPIDFR